MVIQMEELKKLVYLFGFSTRKSTSIDNLFNIVKEQTKDNADVAVVLIHDGVIGTSKKGVMPTSLNLLLNLPMTVFAMTPDLLARGIDPDSVDTRITCIEYDVLVDILAKTPKIASWM
jgi:sulfur relay protein TusB/DsrH